ncbi:MAG: DNA polymerase III subunit delta' [Clostridium sp.]|nr:DNA polymerase III subunit delta' [Clostridium sp.]
MGFNKIIGQKIVVDGLRTSLKNDRIGHAYIFSGPEGIGKRSVANIFSSILICDEAREDESCKKCKPCLLFQNGNNPDFYVLGGTGSSIGVEEIRELQSNISIRPLYSRRKVYIIPGSEKMTVQAQNCLLKTLEEPPKYGTIILTTTNYGALLETIHSRGVRYDFKRNTLDEIREFLLDKHGVEQGHANFIAAYANGIIGRALTLLESEDLKKTRDDIIDILIRMNGEGSESIFEFNALFDGNRDDFEWLLDIMISFYRDLLIAGKGENMLINSDKRDIILNNVQRFSVAKILDNIETIEQTRRAIKQNANYQLAIGVMLMKLREEYKKW